MATPLDRKSLIKRTLSELVDHTNSYNEIDDIKGILRTLIFSVNALLDIVEVPLDTKEQLSLNAAPFQPGCRCKVERESDGSLTIYHCVYHRSIEYIHNGLIAILKEIEEDSLYPSLGQVSPGLEIATAAISTLNRHKKKSFTGEIGKPRDENVGR